MSQLLDSLKALDHNMITLFQDDEIDSETILSLVEEREQILHEIELEFQSVSDFKHSPDWQEAVLRTKRIVELMQLETGQLAKQLKKYRHGTKSVQRYQQFL